jgi:hypothetical protein
MHHGVEERVMALRIVKNLRMQAVKATFGFFPTARKRW